MIVGMEWSQVIRELIDAGLSQGEIASELGVKQPSVSALATGTTKNPSFAVGSKLLDLYRRRITEHAKAA